MHIKNIHDMVEKLTECAKYELDKGVENVDTKEMGEVAEIIKELCEAEYYAKISKAMDEAEYGEDYDEEGPMQERKHYRGQPRSRTSGRFMSRGDGRRSNRGGRRGYEEPMYYDESMMPDEYERDMDREYMKRMYYSGGGSSSSGGGSGSSGGGQSSGSSSSGGSSSSSSGGSRGYSESGRSEQRDSREGRSGQSRKGYMEAKEQGKDKQQKMKELEEYMKSMAEDLTEAIEGATPEERAMAKNKLSVLAQKM